MSSDLDNLLKAALKEEWTLLQKALEYLMYSYEKCRQIGERSEYSADEFERFESLTARFARTSDLYTQRILKTLVALTREEAPTFIDRVNLCEKLGIIASAEELQDIRDLRNSIAHEYIDEDLQGFFIDVLNSVPKLLKSVEVTRAHIKAKIDLEIL